MQKLQNATAVFCLACVCAEILSQVVEAGWPRRCIKGLAGLYILAVLLQVLPDVKLSELLPQEMEAAAISMEPVETAILEQAQQQLEELLAAQCRKRFGVSVQAEVTLQQTAEGTQAEQILLTFPAGCRDETRQAVSAYTEQLLGVPPLQAEDAP